MINRITTVTALLYVVFNAILCASTANAQNEIRVEIALSIENIDQNMDNFRFRMTGISRFSASNGRCLRFVMRDRYENYWVQTTEQELSSSRRNVSIRVGRESSYPLHSYLVLADSDLCREMRRSRQAGRPVSEGAIEALEASFISNRCTASFSQEDDDTIEAVCHQAD
jgi:hypothetical protein